MLQVVMLPPFVFPHSSLFQWHWTPLHEACNNGHANVVETLLKSGADAQVQDNVSVKHHLFTHFMSRV